ncbi:MAG: hypothetical protein IT179_16000 [Acidobacteria bacterium]|nr:hypothetical protein [Acidobacteriota bacterium]
MPPPPASPEYHRLVLDQAFARDDDEARGRRQQALPRLEELGARLDEIREQQPTWPR